MLFVAKKGNNLTLKRLTPVATLIETKQQSATTSVSSQIVTFSWQFVQQAWCTNRESFPCQKNDF